MYAYGMTSFYCSCWSVAQLFAIVYVCRSVCEREQDKEQEKMQHLFLFTRSLAKLPLLEKVNSLFYRTQKMEEERTKILSEFCVCLYKILYRFQRSFLRQVLVNDIQCVGCKV